jgi:hypothetical protein
VALLVKTIGRIRGIQNLVGCEVVLAIGFDLSRQSLKLKELIHFATKN